MNFGGYNEDRSEHMEHREIRSSTNHSFETFGCVGYFVSSPSSFSFAFFIWVQIVKNNFSLANFWQQSITATYSFISYSSFFIVMSCYAFFYSPKCFRVHRRKQHKSGAALEWPVSMCWTLHPTISHKYTKMRLLKLWNFVALHCAKYFDTIKWWPC